MDKPYKWKRINSVKLATQLFLAVFFLSGCATINPALINYNENKQLYEYGAGPENAIPLRNQNNELVTVSNYDSFTEELEKNDNKYQSTKTVENANSIKSVDHRIATLYAESVDALNQKQYDKITSLTNKLRSDYPDAVYFSDVAFLDGYAQEKLGNKEKAKLRYQNFVNYSNGKYTERFRGHRGDDHGDNTWIRERSYAMDYISGGSPQTDEDFFPDFTPKYYYNSLRPGFGLNPEDYDENTKHILMFVFGLDLSDNFSAGIQYYRQLNKYFDINPRYMSSGSVNEVGLAIPIRLYQAEDNSLAFKISPFMNYSYIKELTIDDVTLETNGKMLDFGVKASAGYYFAPKLSLGASYIYHRYNEENTYLLDDQNIEVWYFNEYDISLYYDLFKGFSLKTGIKAGDFVAGIYWSGWEISYDFNQNKMVFRIDMF